MTLDQEIARRRTFAIVSHPDAGKTTLTEKLLLYGGAVQLAGSVTARKKERSTVSDWMEIERKRGISVSSTVLNFDYKGCRINLLDTPGHNDFSEDTYRVLNAVDSVVMVIDGGKGIERQTKKLFEVCRKRSIPVFTFVNKMDRPALDTLALLDEIESVLDIATWPVNVPLGDGAEFKGVWDRRTNLAHLFERTVGGARRAAVTTKGFDDPVLSELLGEERHRRIGEDIALLSQTMPEMNPDDIAHGRTTPVYFGSAANNFGVELLLMGFLDHAPPPAPRKSVGTANHGRPQGTPLQINPNNDAFSGFVFKIQANLDPRHRDRMAFIRIVSGTFTRDMPVIHVQSGKKVRLANSSAVFGRERVSIDEAYPGDIIGVVGTGAFSIGDTLSEDPSICYSEIPRFPPECFSFIFNPVPSNYKRFATGLDQLIQEGLVHALEVTDSGKGPLLAAVGPLQFDLVRYRLEAEYGAASRLDSAPWSVAAWVLDGSDEGPWQLPYESARARDRQGRQVLLFTNERQRDFFRDKHPGVRLGELPG